jgi:hypothetical protein
MPSNGVEPNHSLVGKGVATLPPETVSICGPRFLLRRPFHPKGVAFPIPKMQFKFGITHFSVRLG